MSTQVRGWSRGPRRAALGVLAGLLVGVLGLGAPDLAQAAGGSGGSSGQSALSSSTSALGGGITAPGQPTPTTTPTVANAATGGTSTAGGGFSTGSAIGIAIAAFVIIVGIAAAIFRDENVALEAAADVLANEYNKTVGALSITWDGKPQTLPQAALALASDGNFYGTTKPPPGPPPAGPRANAGRGAATALRRRARTRWTSPRFSPG